MDKRTIRNIAKVITAFAMLVIILVLVLRWIWTKKKKHEEESGRELDDQKVSKNLTSPSPYRFQKSMQTAWKCLQNRSNFPSASFCRKWSTTIPDSHPPGWLFSSLSKYGRTRQLYLFMIIDRINNGTAESGRLFGFMSLRHGGSCLQI